jgi:hypothetical protein
MALTDEHWNSVERICWHAARSHRAETPLLTITDRHEAALLGVAEYLCDNEWPDRDFKPLFLAAAAGISREARAVDHTRHIRHWTYWYEPPGSIDRLEEAITDKIGVHQVCWAMPDDQWSAVWAVAEAMRTGGGMTEAAALLGITTGLLSNRLTRARRTARRLWIAPGDTPRGYYQPGTHDKGSRLQEYRRNRRRTERRTERQTEREKLT